MWKLTP
ncbi:hypothetical protein VTO73DRAFT_8668 [Trametes versicolor]